MIHQHFVGEFAEGATVRGRPTYPGYEHLTIEIHVERQAVTKHLVALAAAGLAQPRREGREQIWELETRRLAVARQTLDRISGQWDSALARLRAFVEE